MPLRVVPAPATARRSGPSTLDQPAAQAGGRIGPAIGVPRNVQGVTATAGGEHVVVNTFDDRGSVTNVYDGETGESWAAR